MLSSIIALLGGSAAPGHWLMTFAGAGSDDRLNACALDTDGSLVAVGYTNSEGAGGNDAWIIKFDATGAITWQRRIGGASADQFNGVSIDASGNIYACGNTSSEGTGGDALIVKYNSAGTKQWEYRWGYSTGADRFNAIALDGSGNPYCAGTSTYGAGGTDLLLVSINPSTGAVSWDRSLGGASNETGIGIAISGSDIFVVGSVSSTGGAGSSDVLIAKYNTSGILSLQRSIGGASGENGYGITVSGSAVYITASTQSAGAGSGDLLLAKYDTSLAIQWQRVLGGTGFDSGTAVAVDGAGLVYVSGHATISSNFSTVVACYDSSGTVQYQRSISHSSPSASNTDLKGIVCDASSAMYVVGMYTPSPGTDTGAFVARLPVDGSKTGTYGSFAYAASSLTGATPTLTDQSRSLTGGTPGQSTAATTLTAATATLSGSLVNL